MSSILNHTLLMTLPGIQYDRREAQILRCGTYLSRTSGHAHKEVLHYIANLHRYATTPVVIPINTAAMEEYRFHRHILRNRVTQLVNLMLEEDDWVTYCWHLRERDRLLEVLVYLEANPWKCPVWGAAERVNVKLGELCVALGGGAKTPRSSWWERVVMAVKWWQR